MHVIRKARMADLDSIAGLWKELMEMHRSLAKRNSAEREMLELAPDAEKRWRAWARKNMRSRNGLLLVAEDDGRIIGYSLSYIKTGIRLFRVKRYGYLSDLFVSKGYRRRGVGSAFLENALAWFRKKGMRHAEIAYRSCNREAARAYAGWGFRSSHVALIRKL